MEADPEPAASPAPPPVYEPPSLAVIGTLEELTLANQPGGSPDFSFNASP